MSTKSILPPIQASTFVTVNTLQLMRYVFHFTNTTNDLNRFKCNLNHGLNLPRNSSVALASISARLFVNNLSENDTIHYKSSTAGFWQTCKLQNVNLGTDEAVAEFINERLPEDFGAEFHYTKNFDRYFFAVNEGVELELLFSKELAVKLGFMGQFLYSGRTEYIAALPPNINFYNSTIHVAMSLVAPSHSSNGGVVSVIETVPLDDDMSLNLSYRNPYQYHKLTSDYISYVDLQFYKTDLSEPLTITAVSTVTCVCDFKMV